MVTEADDWQALKANVREVVRAFYFDQELPTVEVRVRLVRDEVVTIA